MVAKSTDLTFEPREEQLLANIAVLPGYEGLANKIMVGSSSSVLNFVLHIHLTSPQNGGVGCPVYDDARFVWLHHIERALRGVEVTHGHGLLQSLLDALVLLHVHNCPLPFRKEDLELALRMGGGRGRESGRDRTVGGDWNQGDAGGEWEV